MGGSALFIAVFLACMVEAVEATTIVLAAGTARDWRSAFLGVGGALVILAVIIGIAGPAISVLPIGGLRLIVGGLLLVFGLQWIRKAVLRSSGYKALHDEDAIFERELTGARAAGYGRRRGVGDWYAFTLSFKGVLLEGLEVAFIVLTFGTIQHQVGLASLAAVLAVLVVAVAGFAVRRPLARIPENTMKFIVGIMVTSFGVFWGAEGAGASWPGADLALPVLIPAVAIVSLALTGFLRRRRVPSAATAIPVPVAATGTAAMDDGDPARSRRAVPATASMGDAPVPLGVDPGPSAPVTGRSLAARAAGFGAFWYDFIIGDDWQVTAGIVIAFVFTFWLTTAGVTSWWLVPVAVLVLLPYSVSRAIRAH